VYPRAAAARSSSRYSHVVLGQRGDNLITAGLSAAKQLVETYRRHIENHIRAGNAPPP
jgi:hypothetical protein